MSDEIMFAALAVFLILLALVAIAFKLDCLREDTKAAKTVLEAIRRELTKLNGGRRP